jgi:hypothetical protein
MHMLADTVELVIGVDTHKTPTLLRSSRQSAARSLSR